jgi:aldose 1-epimerase
VTSNWSLRLPRPDGDNNFPGQLTAKVTYTLTDDNAIEINYEATTDKETVVNMTNHSYFNLSGDPNNTVADELIMINADAYTPTRRYLHDNWRNPSCRRNQLRLPELKKLGTMFGDADKEIAAAGGGYDHNCVLNTKGNARGGSCQACGSSIPALPLKSTTNEPEFQVYTGNFLDGTAVGKKGITYGKQAAICLESQKFPDSPNNILLKAGELKSVA